MGKRNRKRVRTGSGPVPGGSGQSRAAGPPQRAASSGRFTPPGTARPRATRPGFDEFEELEQVELVQYTFIEALQRFDRGVEDRADRQLELLADWWTGGVGRREGVTPGAVPSILCSYLCGEVESAWERGWQPADLHRLVRRELASAHGDLVVQAIAEQAHEYRSVRPTLQPWLDQLDEIGATASWGPADDHLARLGQDHGLDRLDVLRHVLQLLVLVHHLPEIPRLCPPPTDWGRSAAVAASLDWRRPEGDVDVRYLERIRALLAKAESTEFDEEAASLTAKAHELMTRHAIDAALVEAHATGRKAGEQPVGIRIGIDDPYAQAKSVLLAVIAGATRCRSVWSKSLGFSTVFGYTGDLRAVELLYTSLLLQASSAMARAGQMGRGARRRGFRQSFLIGFAYRIGDRLHEASETTLAGAEAELGDAFLPVLAERLHKVDDLRDTCFPTLDQMRPAAGDLAGWTFGALAADEAQLSVGAPVERRATA